MFSEHNYVYDMNGVLDHEYDDNKKARLEVFLWFVPGLVGALVEVVANGAFGYWVWEDKITAEAAIKK
jgi:hypothetical protein